MENINSPYEGEHMILNDYVFNGSDFYSWNQTANVQLYSLRDSHF